MSLFLPMVDTILNETFVRESLPTLPCCQTCHVPLVAHPPPSSSSLSHPSPAVSTAKDGDDAASPASAVPSVNRLDPSTPSAGLTPPQSVAQLFKCVTCGEFLECRSCCMRRHQYTPLHTLKVSSLGFFWYHVD